MDRLRVVLRCGDIEEDHSWPLLPSGALAGTEAWVPSRLHGRIRVTLDNDNAAIGSWTFGLTAKAAWPEDVIAEIHVGLQPHERPTHVLWPMYYGVFERYRYDHELGGEFRGAGQPEPRLSDEQRLALPFVVLESSSGMWLAGADPTFSATMTVCDEPHGRACLVFSWRWLAAAGIHSQEMRRLFVQLVPEPDVRAALNRWFELATPMVPRGPSWLHDIALQDYDYLSKDGRGWFADIDAACDMIAPQNRHRALFCLHGWYDNIGRYCCDPATGHLDDQWVAFPYINHPVLMERMVATPIKGDVPSFATHAFRNLDRYHPVPLTWDDIRERLRYARERGFRTALYAMTGLMVAGPAEPAVADGTGLEGRSRLWTGPDSIGPTHLLNPLHASVRGRILRYIAALLERVGDLTDALVMDESYYVGYGMLGPQTCPGYADRAQLSLVGEMTALCHQIGPDLAFLTADGLGAPWSWVGQPAFPYSLYADGNYQDSGCWPLTWDCVRLPAWRNTAWSCNWAPVTNLALTQWGVLAHGAPVAISNGCFGDDIGLANMDHETAPQIAGLWRVRLSRERVRSVAVVDASRSTTAPFHTSEPPASQIEVER